MIYYFHVRARLILYGIIILMGVYPSSATAQAVTAGAISGRVTAADGTPLPGVTVRVAPISDSAKARYTLTNIKGIFRLSPVAKGSYRVRFSLLGYESASKEITVDTVTIAVNVLLIESPLESQEIVVTASRHPEKATNAPASISVIPARIISEHVLNTPTDVLTSVPGIDIAHEGIAMATYSSRSFHSVFGSDMLTMNDYHSLEVPAIGGFYGILMPEIPSDIERVEIVRGPGSALYGPDAAPGVIHFISKSPFSSQGTDISVAGGERNYFDGSLRFDQTVGGNFAFKVSAHLLKATDWSIANDPKEDTARKYAQQALHPPAGSLSTDTITALPIIDSLNRIGNRDSGLEVYSLEARADAIIGDNATANITAGLTRLVDDVALTEDFGGAQIKDWQYEYILGHVNDGDLFMQASIDHNNTQGSYFLVTGAPIVDRSTTYNVQIQDQYNKIPFEQLTYGADFKAIHPITEGTLYGPDDGHANTSIIGAYAQSETKLLDNWELVLSGRLDKHNALTNPIFSPHAAVVYHLDENNLFRAMYNVTYLFPSITGLYADLLYSTTPPYTVRYVSPYVSGYTFTPNTDGSYNMNTPLPIFDSMPQVGSQMTTAQAQAKLWPVVMDLAAKLSGNNLLKSIPAPSKLITYLGYPNVGVNASTQPFIPIPDGVPIPISPVQPQHQRTLEVDYEGSISKSFHVEADAYQTHYSVIRASTVALTPTVAFDSADLQQYFKGEFAGLPDADSLAQVLAGQLQKVPLGVVQASDGAANESYPDDILVGTRSYLQNTVEFFGIDLFTTIQANNSWSFDGSFSWLNKDYWYAGELNSTPDSTQQSPFALNMPKYRFSIGAKYSGLTNGLGIELRDRWSDAFPMNDNYYIGNVGARHVLDLTVDYRIQSENPSWNHLLLTLSVTNLLNNVHQEFIGAPYIGRLAVLRAAYTLPAL